MALDYREVENLDDTYSSALEEYMALPTLYMLLRFLIIDSVTCE